jgi:hypothetical protein
MLDALAESFTDGRLELEQNGGPVPEPAAARAIVEGRLEQTLSSLARNALLGE